MRQPSARTTRWAMNLWPPFLFSGIRVLELDQNWHHARVVLRRHWFNRNYVGTQFGGSLFAMTDPFWMLMIMRALGSGYIVWDKAAAIEFVAPGRSDVFAEFHLEDSVVEELRAAAASGEKHLRWFETGVTTREGEIIALVRKRIYVRRKADTISRGLS